ncbi:MAG: SusC/RagA family TonB-linked outer membrane protein [Pedobacter sp.]|jgi:TonB-linked SusC/RagA family outer membrane protein
MKYFTINASGPAHENFNGGYNNRRQLIKQIMRTGFFSIVLLLTSLQLLLALPVKSQKISSVEVRLELRNETLMSAFRQIEKQTPFRFVYRKGELMTLPSRNISASTYTVEQVLNMLLEDTDLSYKQVDNNVLIQTKDSQLSGLAKSVEIDNSAAEIPIHGQVVDTNGETLPGVSIKIKGTMIGATTDMDGRFTINVPDNSSVLVFTYIGYQTQEITVGSRTTLNVKLEAASTALTEVVITALGISREKKGLVSAVTEVKGSEFTQARENNIANALTGKIAGVNVTGMASGPGGSSRVVIRGNGSLNGNNQPLYVINGMPMNNIHREIRPGDGTIFDQGDGITAINPDDIETITVLKGGAAAALYGSQAANGVVLITTKKGKVQQGIGVEIHSNSTVGVPSMYPEFQYEYGQGMDGIKPRTQSEAIASGRLNFGPKIEGNGEPYIQFDGVMRPYKAVNVKDNWKNFYRPSTTLTNTVALSGGSSAALVYRLSMSDLQSRALQPGSSYSRETANLNIRSELGKKFIAEATVQYNFDHGVNRPGNGYADNTTSWALNLVPTTVDIRDLAPGYDKNYKEVGWQAALVGVNPYFLINRMGNNDSKNRFIGQGSVQYNILDNFFIKATGVRDIDYFESMNYEPVGTANNPKGKLNSGQSFGTETTGQVILNYNTSFLNNFQINGMAGGALQKSVFNSTTLNGAEFIVPDFISYNNLALQSTRIGFNQSSQNSVFGSVDLNYKKLLYLVLTGRKDWFSVLNPGNNSIFYPSIGASFILSDALKLPDAISFAKLRASWAQVGGATVGPYQINTSYNFLAGGFNGLPVQTTSSGLANPDLRPLTSTTYEMGLNVEFLNNRLGVDITYYNRETTDDILAVPLALSSGNTSALLNLGALSNKGVELLLTGRPLNSSNFKWDVSYNAAYNKSEVLKLAPNVETVGGSRVGDPFNTLQSTTYVTNEKGQRVYNKVSGFEVKGPLQSAGTGVPPYTMGLNNTFRYKKFSLDVLVDGKFGNVVTSTLSAYMYRFGLSKKTLAGRENGLTVSGVDQAGLPFTKTWPVDQLDSYYNTEQSISPMTLITFDGSFIKLRSVILGYTIPANKLKFAKIQSIGLSLVARNLAILYKKVTDFDPESAYTISNDQTRTSNTIPRTREIGIDLIVKF